MQPSHQSDPGDPRRFAEALPWAPVKFALPALFPSLPPSLPFLGKYSFHTSVCRQMPGNGLWLGCHGDLLRRLLPSSLTIFRAPTLQYYWESVLTTANQEKKKQQQQQQQKKASCWWVSRVCHLLLKNKWLHSGTATKNVRLVNISNICHCHVSLSGMVIMSLHSNLFLSSLLKEVPFLPLSLQHP